MRGQLPLGLDRRRHGVARRAKRAEQRIALRINHLTLRGCDRVLQQTRVLGQDGRVAIAAQTLQQLVEPSMSVNKKVTVPLGSPAVGATQRF